MEDHSCLNPQESSFCEPLNLNKELKGDFVSFQKQADIKQFGSQTDPYLWTYELVTERQVVIDCILLLMGHESPTFKRVKQPSKTTHEAKSFAIRKPIYVSHLSPMVLNEMLLKFIELSKTI